MTPKPIFSILGISFTVVKYSGSSDPGSPGAPVGMEVGSPELVPVQLHLRTSLPPVPRPDVVTAVLEWLPVHLHVRGRSVLHVLGLPVWPL